MSAALSHPMEAPRKEDPATPEPGVIENDVLHGRDGYLFLAGGGHSVLDYCLGRAAPRPQSFADFRVNLEDRARIAASVGARYLHIISPDKQSVLLEAFPFPDPVQMGKAYRDGCADLELDVFYHADLLRRQTFQTYHKTDTHMTDAGTIAVAEDLVLFLTGAADPAIAKVLYDNLVARRTVSGDLGVKVTPQLAEERLDYAGIPGSREIWLHNNMVGGNNGIVDIRFNPDAPLNERVVMFGDSFGRELVRFLAVFYRQIVFFRTPHLHAELVEAMGPTIVITQNVERYLPSTERDEVRPNFFMYPYLNGQPYQPGRDFAEGLSAVLSFGRPAYADYLARLGMEPGPAVC